MNEKKATPTRARRALPLCAILVIMVIGVQTINAQILAVLEIVPSSEEVDLSVTEFRHLTDELRTQAREALPRNYSVLTRDNIIQLLPPTEDQANCLDESCAVEIGRAIGSEYVTQGFVGKFEGMLTLTIELYESMSGNMLGSFVTENENARGLLATIRERAPGLFARIKPIENGELRMENNYQPPAVHQRDAEREGNSQFSILNSQLNNEVSNVQSNSQLKQSNSSFFIALSLDVLGAAAIGFGVYQNIKVDKLNTDYRKMPSALPANENELEELKDRKKEEWKKVKDAKNLRNIAYGVGGALLAAGITVHVWF